MNQDSPKSMIGSLQSIYNFGKDVTLSLISETITSLMHRIDYNNNQNLFYIIRFVSNYRLSDISQYQKIMEDYGKIVKDTNYKCFRKIVDDTPKEFRNEYMENFPDYIQMIDLFNLLPNYEQKNIKNLAWFILYCKKYNLDSSNSHRIWERYEKLSEEIKSLNRM